MLGAQYVEYIHDELLEVFWPSSDKVATKGVRDGALIESAVGRPFQSAFGQDIYPTTIEKGVALFHALIANHAFVDGNKRTAVTALDHFLLANGFVLGIPNSAMYELATNTASYRERKVSHEDSLVEIVDAIEKGEWALAEQLMQRHIGNVQAALKLQSPSDDALAELRDALRPLQDETSKTHTPAVAQALHTRLSAKTNSEPSTYLKALL